MEAKFFSPFISTLDLQISAKQFLWSGSRPESFPNIQKQSPGGAL